MWDSTNCIFALAPAPWARGNSPSSFSSGGLPSFPSGAYQPCTLTNMSAGYGFFKDVLGGFLNFDGDNDYVNVGDVVELNDVATFSIEMWVAQSNLGATDVYFHKDKDSNNKIQLNTASNIMYLRMKKGANTLASFDHTTVMCAGKYAHLVWVYNGGEVDPDDRIRLWANGSEESLSASGGDLPATSPDMSGADLEISDPTYALGGKVAWFAIYTDASTTRPATNYQLGKNMSLKGFNTSGVLELNPVTISWRRIGSIIDE